MMRAALPFAAVLCLASGASAQTEQTVELSDEMRAGLTSEIQRAGYECPAVKTVLYVGYDHQGRHVRVTCATSPGGAADPALTFRATVTTAGFGRVTPWR